MSGKCMPPNMKRIGAATMGDGSPDKMVQQIPLKATANHCYRVVGIADATVTDFDIAVMDSASKEIAEDVLDSNDAVVLEDGAFCFNTDDAASVNVAVANGTGKWAVEIWSDDTGASAAPAAPAPSGAAAAAPAAPAPAAVGGAIKAPAAPTAPGGKPAPPPPVKKP